MRQPVRVSLFKSFQDAFARHCVNPAQFQHFDDIDPSFTRLAFRDERLWTLENGRNILLGEISVKASLFEQVDQASIFPRVKGLLQAGQTFGFQSPAS